MIIFDRKKKRKVNDEQWNDPLGVEEAKQNKARTIEIPKGSKNPCHQVMLSEGVKGLLGRKVWCFTDKKEIINGRISDIIPPCYIVIKNKGVAHFNDVISIGG